MSRWLKLKVCSKSESRGVSPFGPNLRQLWKYSGFSTPWLADWEALLWLHHSLTPSPQTFSFPSLFLGLMAEFPLLIVLCMVTSNLAMASLENPISNRCGIGHKLVQSNPSVPRPWRGTPWWALWLWMFQSHAWLLVHSWQHSQQRLGGRQDLEHSTAVKLGYT